MSDARIVIRSPGEPEREMELPGGATIGRAFDNAICIDNSSISRYHAIIEERNSDFWLSDLGSRNGTTVNGEQVDSERKLQNGDLISIGGAGTIEFHSDDGQHPAQEHSTDASPATGFPAPPRQSASVRLEAGPSSGPSRKLVVAGVAGGLIIVAAAALLIGGVFGSSSTPTVRIVSPQTGATVRGVETIRVEATDAKRIERVIYLLDGVEIASSMFQPYDARLDPAELDPILRKTGSGNHILTATVEDEDGNKKAQADTIVLSFDTTRAASDDGQVADSSGGDADGGKRTGQLDIASLCRNLAGQISGKSWYIFDAEFAEQIRLRTSEYRINFIDNARRYRREIASAFSSKGLPLPLGFVTAASQSKFQESTSDSDQSVRFWRVPRRIAVEQGYISRDEPASALADPKRSAEIAAAYTKELINVFGMDDFMLAIACYGMPISEAAQVRTRIEESDPEGTTRRSFWRLVKLGVVTREGADRVTRFFAAGIVGENPKLFGVGAEPLSSLY